MQEMCIRHCSRDQKATRTNSIKVIEAFQKYCSPHKNILYGRYGFWSLHQEDQEPIDAYLTRLKIKIDMCEYVKEGWPPAVREELTRNKFVFRLIDDNLKERLLREPNLDLNRVVEIAQRGESSKQQVKEMAACTNVSVLQRNKEKPLLQDTPPDKSGTPCGQCGRQHRPRECPAYGQKCSYCHNLNHFTRMCRHKQPVQRARRQQIVDTQSKSRANYRVHEVEQSDTSFNASAAESPDLFIEPIQVEGVKKSSAWFADVSTSGGKLTFKLDTGAEVSVLPLQIYDKLQSKPLLKSTNMKLTTYGGSSIKLNGTCRLTCSNQAKDSTCEVKFYLAPVNAQPILGLGDCVQLDLVKRVYSMQEEGLTKAKVSHGIQRSWHTWNVSHYSARQLHTCDKPSQMHSSLVKGQTTTIP